MSRAVEKTLILLDFFDLWLTKPIGLKSLDTSI